MKTPEDIKKGLECCKSNPTCSVCPYYNEDDCKVMESDALAYIQQLEQEKTALLGVLKEVDLYGECPNCKHNGVCDCEEYDFDCASCKRDCKCGGCEGGSNWEWKGIQGGVNPDNGQ